MFESTRRKGAFSRRLPAAALAGACLLVAALALAACGPGVQASGPLTGRGASAATPAASATAEAWADAGRLTPTPGVSGNAEPAGTPGPDATAASTGDSYQAVNFTGPVEILPATGWTGRWQVGGRAVNVSPTTVVTQQAGQITRGAQVNVEGWQQPDGTVEAGWITVISPAANNGNAGSQPGSGNTGNAPAGATANNGNAGSQPGSGNAGNAPAGATPAVATPAVSAQPGAAGADGESEDNHNDNEDDNDKNDQAQPDGATVGDRAVQPIELRGYVEALPAQGFVGDWRVNGRTVHVNARTRLNQKLGAFVDGSYVQLMGWQQPDGSINAAWIQVKKAPGGNGENGNGNGNNGNGNNGNGNGKGNGKGNGNGKGKGGD